MYDCFHRLVFQMQPSLSKSLNQNLRPLLWFCVITQHNTSGGHGLSLPACCAAVEVICLLAACRPGLSVYMVALKKVLRPSRRATHDSRRKGVSAPAQQHADFTLNERSNLVTFSHSSHSAEKHHEFEVVLRKQLLQGSSPWPMSELVDSHREPFLLILLLG